jgi:hypothetical protein
VIPLAQTILRPYTDYETAEGDYLSVKEFSIKSNAAADMNQLQVEIVNYLIKKV